MSGFFHIREETEMEEKINDDILAHLYNFYNDNPYVKLLHIRIEEVAYGRVTLSMEASEKLSNFYHIMHGGALMSLADTAMGATCLSVNKKVVTQSMNSHFIRAVSEGTRLFASGTILHNGRKTLVCETRLTDEEGNLFCQATGNFFVIGPCIDAPV